VGRGVQASGHLALWFLEEQGPGALPSFVSPFSGALNNSQGTLTQGLGA